MKDRRDWHTDGLAVALIIVCKVAMFVAVTVVVGLLLRGALGG